jgi:hypothetical protein
LAIKVIDLNTLVPMAEQVRVDLPAMLLEAVAMSEPCVRVWLERKIADVMPSDTGTVPISAEDVSALIDALVERGDLLAERRGILRCLPPHLVGPFGADDYLEFAVYGNPLVEPVLINRIGPLGGILVHTTRPVVAGWSANVERGLLVPASSGVTVESLLSLGVTVMSASMLLESLPGIDDLARPSPNWCCARPESGGRWQEYCPTGGVPYQAGRWRDIRDWMEVGPLLRLEIGFGRSGRPVFSFCEHAGGGLVREISWGQALLWQYRVDRDLSYPTSWRHDRATSRLEIGNSLPPLHSQALRLVCGAPERRGYARVYDVKAAEIPSLRGIAATLGVDIADAAHARAPESKSGHEMVGEHRRGLP